MTSLLTGPARRALVLAFIVVVLDASPASADRSVLSLSLDTGPQWTGLYEYYVSRDYPTGPGPTGANVAWWPTVGGRVFIGGSVSSRLSVGFVGTARSSRWNLIGPHDNYYRSIDWSIGVGVDRFPDPGRRGLHVASSIGVALESIYSIGYTAVLDVGYAMPFGRAGIVSVGGGLAFRHVIGRSEGDHGDYHLRLYALAPTFVVRLTRRCTGSVCPNRAPPRIVPPGRR